MTFWKRKDGELDDEIRAHFAIAVRERMERGEDRQTAEREARKEFGSTAQVRETVREVWGWRGLENLVQDIRYAWRGLRRSPGFAAVAIGSLALGIGANTAIFTLVYAVMLKTLPVKNPHELVELLQKYPSDPRGNGYWSRASFEHFRDNNHVFSVMSGSSTDNHAEVRIGDSEVEIMAGEYVLGNYFEVLGVQPVLGRAIGAQDKGEAAVVSWALWQARYEGNAAILGKRIVVDKKPMTIVGVAPRAFTGLRADTKTAVWLSREPGMQAGLAMFARLKEGATLEHARAEMRLLYQFTIDEEAKNSKDSQVRKMKVEVESAATGFSPPRDRFGRPLVVLMTVVAVLLAIACINMASMMLARAASRQRELAVRVGLGASRLRLIQQTMTESLMLSVTGALVGVVLAHWATAALLRIMASGRQHERVSMDIQPDAQTLLFTAGIAVLTGILFGLAPAWYAFRTAPASPLRQAGVAGETRLGRVFGSGLVVAQVAASVVLLGAAGLFVSYLSKLRNLDLGFQRENILLMRVEPEQGMDRAVRALRYKELLQRLAAIPGVRSVSIGGATPIQGAAASRMVIAEGFTERPEERRWVHLNWVAPKYFETMGTPLLRGRDFQFEDEGRAPVMIVNQALVDYYFKGVNPIGKHLQMDSNNDKGVFEIVGVVGNAKYTELRDAPPRTMYRNTFQRGYLASQFVLRTHGNPESIVGLVRRPVKELLPGARIDGILTMAEQIDGAIVPERLIAQLTGLFGALGALIAAIGLYGLLAYSVARRTSEIGIRMALGATQADVYRAVLRQALTITAVGLMVGSVLAYWGEGLAGAMVADLPVEHHLPLLFGAAVTVGLALLAAFVPARRAARVDPVQALRSE